jgi:type IV secretion system protein VirD4
MVSRQETARPLLTPGEVMQLAAADELVLVSGCPPIRAKKVRYYEDGRLKRRILAPPMLLPNLPVPEAASEWGGLIRDAGPRPPIGAVDDENEGGLRREPELGAPDSVEAPLPDLATESPLVADDADAETAAAARLRSRVRQAARQASLDPDDDIPL